MSLETKLASRKNWRIKKFSQTPQVELSSTTIKLFSKWGVALIGPKKVKRQVSSYVPPVKTELSEFMRKKIKGKA